MKYVLKFFCGLLCLLLWNTSIAQVYELSCKKGEYQPLLTRTMGEVQQDTIESRWSETYISTKHKIPIGFVFSIENEQFDSLWVNANTGEISLYGALNVQINRLFEFLKYENIDAISYELSLNETQEKILKIEFDNGILCEDSKEFVNFQVWLYERTNAIEFHMGPNCVNNLKHFGGDMGPVIGILGSNEDYNFAYVLSGTASEPVLSDEPSLDGLEGVPFDGLVYRLSPKMH